MLFMLGKEKRAAFRRAEEKLLAMSSKFRPSDTLSDDNQDAGLSIEQIDTEIPASVVPLKGHHHEKKKFTIHGVRVQRSDGSLHDASGPLVMVHGYMNASAYYYRNFLGLSKAFSTIYSLDMLGWGLSSRPKFDLIDRSVKTCEDFFVESLEAWRKEQRIDRMVLAGHSMGGYLSVAYCERYPERVDRLLLISPVGVPQETEEVRAKRKGRSESWGTWFYLQLFELGVSPCSALRMLPKNRGMQYFNSWADNRLQHHTDQDEKETIANYLYYNSILPGSGENCLKPLLTPFAYANHPTVHRIPKLKVSHVSFLYGKEDWMDSKWALQVEKMCEERKQNNQHSPSVQVFSVKEAGHMLMLENWEEFNAGMLLSVGCSPTPGSLIPEKLSAN